ncbi:MAG: ParA family protein [Candidatus Hadarchaeia archaeon]
MSYRITVSNQKGGVGKTTICLHLAVGLARRDRDVLLVDLDPSAYLSVHLGFDREYYDENKNSLAYNLVEGPHNNPDDIIISTDEGVDLVPSNFDMRGVEDRLNAERNREMRLKMLLDSLEQDYDYIMVDSPPSVGILYDNAILACRHVVIPIKDEEMSIVSVHRALDEIEEIENAFGTGIEILAIVPNLVRPDGVASKTLKNLRNMDGLKEYLTDFEIRQRVAIRRSMKNRTTLYNHKPSNDQIENFMKLADLVISKCEGGAEDGEGGE